MKLLIGQPKREENLGQLQYECQSNPEIEAVLFPEGYFRLNQIEQVRKVAEKHAVTIVAGYKDEHNLDRAFVINESGEIILKRPKTRRDEKQYSLSRVENDGWRFGYLLCMEIFYGLEGLDKKSCSDIIFNPIGVGMFSEKQFEEWISEARKIAKSRNSLILGASHSDGSYRNCGFSIPIAYCFDEAGNDVFIAHNHNRTRILDTETREVEVLGYMPLTNTNK